MKYAYSLYKVSSDLNIHETIELKDCFDSYEKFILFAKKRGLSIGPKWRTQNKLFKKNGQCAGIYYFKIKKVKTFC